MSDEILIFQIVGFGIITVVDINFEGLLLLEEVVHNDICDERGVKVVRHDLCLAQLLKLPVSVFLV